MKLPGNNLRSYKYLLVIFIFGMIVFPDLAISKIDNTKEPILIENFISHPVYTLGNALIGKYLQLFKESQCIGLLRKGDIRGEVLFRSYGIEKFYYYKTWGFFKRCKYKTSYF